MYLLKSLTKRIRSTKTHALYFCIFTCMYAHFCLYLVFGVPVVVNDLRCVAFVDKEHFVNICRMVERSLYCDFKFMKGNVRGNA